VFVGHRGDRINTILSLLNGEKIDIIEDTGDEVRLVMDVLRPAKVISVNMDEEEGKIYVQVPEDQKALAIGKGAVNIKLAGQIVGKRIELV
jgi:N utilization substance protein A